VPRGLPYHETMYHVADLPFIVAWEVFFVCRHGVAHATPAPGPSVKKGGGGRGGSGERPMRA